MFGPLIIGYLFVGGAGAGLCFVLCSLCVVFLNDRKTRGLFVGADNPRAAFSKTVSYRTFQAPSAYKKVFFPAFITALILLLLGMVFLAADLGRPDRLFLVVTFVTPTFITLGSISLFVCSALTVLVVVVWGGYFRLKIVVVKMALIVLLVASFLVIAYTGLLLRSLGAVPLWCSDWLAVLFSVSALSCGTVLVLALTQFSGVRLLWSGALRRLSQMHMVIVVLESVAACFFVGGALTVVEPGLSGQALSGAIHGLLCGTYADLFWFGFVGLGLVGSFLTDAASMHLKHVSAAPILFGAGCVLSGALIMRFCVIQAGLQPISLV